MKKIKRLLITILTTCIITTMVGCPQLACTGENDLGSRMLFGIAFSDRGQKSPFDGSESGNSGEAVPGSNGSGGMTSGPTEVISNNQIQIPVNFIDPKTGNEVTIDENTTIVIKDFNGNEVDIEVEIVGDTVIITIPDGLTPEDVYIVSVTNPNDDSYEEIVILPYEDLCSGNSLYADALDAYIFTGNSSTRPLSDYVVGNYGIVKWKFDEYNFRFKITNRNPNYTYIIVVAAGKYDISGQECNLYYQRFASRPYNPVIDILYTGQNYLIDDQDICIENCGANKLYFEDTYVVVKVFDQNGNDVTDIDNSNVVLTKTTEQNQIK